MRPAISSTISCLALLLVINAFAGCARFKRAEDSSFLKPLGQDKTELNAANRSKPLDERTLCMETAKTVAAKGHANEASKLYLRAESLAPDQPPLDSELAPLLASLGQFEDSIQRYQRLTSSDPGNQDHCNNFAWTLMEARRYEEAIAEAQRGLELEPKQRRLRTTLAMIHYRRGERQLAERHFTEALGAADAFYNLALLDIDDGNLDSARQSLMRANQTPSPNPNAAKLLASLGKDLF
ncbi:tetratricopeptide repeat protein [Rhodopirellula sp. JC740]|uniref:Tetratricopeptide repeat protein n=1 Tax=Rhodopirellula halodulae TaxID=2894198 RepID=A0ABS8NIF7_9BACT|nr:tetratricopeptide repeat protein [Rhodopirellula sp. JC740]MCC9643194.1 tetratricopeptide repeat protein [Rhodopirellula sp. JC740]